MTEREISRRTLLLGGFVGGVSLLVGCAGKGDQKRTVLPSLTVEQPSSPPAESVNPSVSPSEDPPVSSSEKGRIIFRQTSQTPQVFLTIDDGWDTHIMSQALALAQKEEIKFTIFPVGKAVKANPTLYQEFDAEGHLIGNHTYTHPLLKSNVTEKTIRDEIQRQHDAVQEAVGRDYTQYFFRPPGGEGAYPGAENKTLLRVCQELGYDIAMWSADSAGWKEKGNNTTSINRVLNNITIPNDNLSPYGLSIGVIVLQHALPVDIAVLPFLITRAKERGFTMPTMQELV